MTDTIERDLAEAAVDTGNCQNGIAVVKDTGGAARVGDVKLVTQAEGLMLHGQILNTEGVNAHRVALFIGANEVVIGKNEDIFTTEVICDRVNFMGIEDLNTPRRVLGKIRYNHKGEYCVIEKLPDGRVKGTFENAVRAATPGQAFVFYEGEHVLGGGTIVSSRA